MIKTRGQMECSELANCHEGTGTLGFCQVLQPGDSDVGLEFLHDDILPPGVSIGEHLHGDEGFEEVYFVVEGHGTMMLDGRQYPIGPGDVSLCKPGHRHGIVNSGNADMRLIVVGVRQRRIS